MERRIEGITVHYDSYGEGRPLLVLPGWAASARYSAHFRESLFGDTAGWRRIYVDPPGYGRTPGAPWITNMDGLLELLVSFVDAVLPGESFALAGYSAGAYLYAFSFDVDDLEEPFPRPALILAGRQDSVVGYSDAWQILENFPRATFVILDRAGHLLEEKERLNQALVREWLDRVEETERYAVY